MHIQPSSENASVTNLPGMAAVGDGAWKERVRKIASELPARSALFPFDGRDPRAAEQYKIIRTKLLQYPRMLNLMAVTSPQLGDGKSVTAANIAGALALKHEIE